jgi:hypothetical protein
MRTELSSGNCSGLWGRGYCTSTISGTAGSTNFFLKKSCLETKRFSTHAWRENDVVRPKTVEGRKDLQSFSKHSKTPITRVTMRPVSGLAILSLNPSLQMKLTDDYAAGNTDAHKSPVDECYGLWVLKNSAQEIRENKVASRCSINDFLGSPRHFPSPNFRLIL